MRAMIPWQKLFKDTTTTLYTGNAVTLFQPPWADETILANRAPAHLDLKQDHNNNNSIITSFQAPRADGDNNNITFFQPRTADGDNHNKNIITSFLPPRTDGVLLSAEGRLTPPPQVRGELVGRHSVAA
jgi:hypothetical protein